ncbi:MAG: alkaline phosphatase family protein [Candidatus Delongbacteria bacterium]|nr:alkaline phosphatase family protein [Candidatus Delongbacteria bacterium]MBN2835903.1 alkaline phosphatase family protein [Candidatus Delongbacteria bacterium]
MIKPDFNGGCTINLLSSILNSFNVKWKHNELNLLSSNEIKKYKNRIVFLIDGLGYNYLKKNSNSFLYKNLRGAIDSVFPSTTTCSLTTFSSGLNVIEHGFTGWYMKMDEISKHPFMILPLAERKPNSKFKPDDEKLKSILPDSISNYIKDSHLLIPDYVGCNSFCTGSSPKSKSHIYTSFDELVEIVSKLTYEDGEKYIYIYNPLLDSRSHEFGVNSKEANDVFYELDNLSEKLFMKSNNNSIIIYTADHGQLDTENSKVIVFNDYPELMDLLSYPLCGEPRCAYVYTNNKRKFYEKVIQYLGEKIEIYDSVKLVEAGYFGDGKENLEFKNRIGDFILIPKENYILCDFIDGEERQFNIGNHGGLSEDEVKIPLVVVSK